MRRRHALVVGIDTYRGFGPESQLAGAVRDAAVMSEVLTERHAFAPGDVLRLCEAEATRTAIVGALGELRGRIRGEDEVVFYFSGHGSQMTDREGDEGDGLDETVVPFDSGRDDAENRDITDDEIHDWAAGVLEITPHLTLIFDCCHGGTLQRLDWRVRSVPPDLRPVEALPPSPCLRRDVATGPRPLVLAACGDDERAVELPSSVAGEVRGAFSFHLLGALRAAAPEDTWRGVFARVEAAVAADVPEQHPRLSGDGMDSPIFGGLRPGAHVIGRRLLGLAADTGAFGLAMELFRSRGGAWRPVGESSLREGDRLRVDLRHGHCRELFVYLLDIGLTGRVSLLFPDLDGHEVLDPGTVLAVGARRGDVLESILPADLPGEDAGGTGHLLLVASESRIATARLFSGSTDLPHDVSAVVRPYRLERR